MFSGICFRRRVASGCAGSKLIAAGIAGALHPRHQIYGRE